MAVAAPAVQVTARSRVWFNPDLYSRNYVVPGVTLMLTALAIVREKEIGTMEQLMVTPLRPVELMLGKTLPFALLLLFCAASMPWKCKASARPGCRRTKRPSTPR